MTNDNNSNTFASPVVPKHPGGRPSKPETLDKLRDDSERATLKLCAKLRQMTESAADKLVKRLDAVEGGGPVSVGDHAKALESLARAGELVARTEAAIRKTQQSGDPSGGETAEDLLGELK